MRAHICSELRFVLHLQLYTFPPPAAHLHLHTLVSADLHLHLHNLTSVDLLSFSLYSSLFLPFFFLIENLFFRNFLLNTYCIKFTSPSTTALSLFSYLELLDNHLFRSRANRSLVGPWSGFMQLTHLTGQGCRRQGKRKSWEGWTMWVQVCVS